MCNVSNVLMLYLLCDFYIRQSDLYRILKAYSLYDPQTGYCQVCQCSSSNNCISFTKTSDIDLEITDKI